MADLKTISDDELELSLSERQVVASERIATLLDELVQEIADRVACLTDAVDDLRLEVRKRNGD